MNLEGCEAKYKTPVPEERICPVCGREVEVFARRGRLVADFRCECGYVFPAEAQDDPALRSAEKYGAGRE